MRHGLTETVGRYLNGLYAQHNETLSAAAKRIAELEQQLAEQVRLANKHFADRLAAMLERDAATERADKAEREVVTWHGCHDFAKQAAEILEARALKAEAEIERLRKTVLPGAAIANAIYEAELRADARVAAEHERESR